MKLHPGIDGGGTRTRAVLVDVSGRIHGGGAGPCSYHALGLERAQAALTAAAHAAWRAAGLEPRPPEHAFIGGAGVKAADQYRADDFRRGKRGAFTGRAAHARYQLNTGTTGQRGRRRMRSRR